jgi:nitroreductase
MPATASAPVHQLTALDAIYARRSVRAFTKQRVSEPTIRQLIAAAVRAPTALHTEPWVFAVLTDRTLLQHYSDRAKSAWLQGTEIYRELHERGLEREAQSFLQVMMKPGFSIFYDAPALILIGARPLGPFVTADCWLAAENLMLAASALGLGTCCIGSAIPMFNLPDVKAELGLPPEIIAVAPIVVGTPRQRPKIQPRRDPEIVVWK